MKYIIINGSYHMGNTWRLIEVAKRKIAALDSSATFQEIHLSKFNIPFCTGCSNCFRLGFEKCPHFDKTSELINAIDTADGVIVTSTTYNMRETALLKNLFDHLCFMLHCPYFFKSKALIFTTTGGIGGNSAAKSIKSFLADIGFNRCYKFSKASFSWNNYIPNQSTVKKVDNLTMKFYNDVASQKIHPPSTILLIPYNLFRGMSLAYIKGSEYETKDGEHWTQSNRKNRVYDEAVPVLFIQKPIGHLFYIIGKAVGKMKRTQVTYRK